MTTDELLSLRAWNIYTARNSSIDYSDENRLVRVTSLASLNGNILQTSLRTSRREVANKIYHLQPLFPFPALSGGEAWQTRFTKLRISRSFLPLHLINKGQESRESQLGSNALLTTFSPVLSRLKENRQLPSSSARAYAAAPLFSLSHQKSAPQHHDATSMH